MMFAKHPRTKSHPPPSSLHASLSPHPPHPLHSIASLRDLTEQQEANHKIEDARKTTRSGLLILSCLITLALLIGTLIYQYYTLTSVYNHYRTVSTLQQVPLSISQLYADIMEAEAGHRAFLLTNDTHYYPPMDNIITGSTSSSDRLSSIGSILQISSNATGDLQLLDQHILTEYATLQQTMQWVISNINHTGVSDAINATIIHSDNIVMIRTIMSRLWTTSQQAIQDNQDSVDSSYHQMMLTIFISFGLVAISVLIGAVLNRSWDTKMSKQEYTRLQTLLEEATSATRMKALFLANMSHEIRTPMNGVVTMTDLLAKTELTAEQGDILDTVRSSADAMMRLINDILLFSKIEAGKFVLSPERFSLSEFLKPIIDMFTIRAKSKNLVFTSTIDINVPFYIYADTTRLRQILVNLIDNGLKYTHTGSVRLVVQVRPLRTPAADSPSSSPPPPPRRLCCLSSHPITPKQKHCTRNSMSMVHQTPRRTPKTPNATIKPNNQHTDIMAWDDEAILHANSNCDYNNRDCELVFRVIDTGIGIPAHARQQIFEPFSQQDMSSTRIYGGSGLGLSISRQLVNLMGGEMSLVSEVGKGSTFTFTLFCPLVTIDKNEKESMDDDVMSQITSAMSMSMSPSMNTREIMLSMNPTQTKMTILPTHHNKKPSLPSTISDVSSIYPRVTIASSSPMLQPYIPPSDITPMSVIRDSESSYSNEPHEISQPLTISTLTLPPQHPNTQHSNIHPTIITPIAIHTVVPSDEHDDTYPRTSRHVDFFHYIEKHAHSCDDVNKCEHLHIIDLHPKEHHDPDHSHHTSINMNTSSIISLPDIHIPLEGNDDKKPSGPSSGPSSPHSSSNPNVPQFHRITPKPSPSTTLRQLSPSLQTRSITTTSALFHPSPPSRTKSLYHYHNDYKHKISIQQADVDTNRMDATAMLFVDDLYYDRNKFNNPCSPPRPRHERSSRKRVEQSLYRRRSLHTDTPSNVPAPSALSRSNSGSTPTSQRITRHQHTSSAILTPAMVASLRAPPSTPDARNSFALPSDDTNLQSLIQWHDTNEILIGYASAPVSPMILQPHETINFDTIRIPSIISNTSTLAPPMTPSPMELSPVTPPIVTPSITNIPDITTSPTPSPNTTIFHTGSTTSIPTPTPISLPPPKKRLTTRSSSDGSTPSIMPQPIQPMQPISQPPRTAVVSPRTQVKPYNLNVLLAEDNVINQKVAMKLLDKLGCTVTLAKNGKEAVDYFIANPPGTFDIILMDIHMPILDGLSAVRLIRQYESTGSLDWDVMASTASTAIATTSHSTTPSQSWRIDITKKEDEPSLVTLNDPLLSTHPPTSRIRIIAVTASALDEDKSELGNGLDDVIVKPIDIKIFSKKLHRIAHRKHKHGTVNPTISPRKSQSISTSTSTSDITLPHSLSHEQLSKHEQTWKSTTPQTIKTSSSFKSLPSPPSPDEKPQDESGPISTHSFSTASSVSIAGNVSTTVGPVSPNW